MEVQGQGVSKVGAGPSSGLQILQVERGRLVTSLGLFYKSTNPVDENCDFVT